MATMTSCPGCGGPLRLPDRARGARLQCPRCGSGVFAHPGIGLPGAAGPLPVEGPARGRPWACLLVPAVLAAGAGLFWGAGLVLDGVVDEARAGQDVALARAEERLRAAEAEAERLDGPWRPEDLDARREPVPEEANAARTVRAAADRMPPRWPAWFFELAPVRLAGTPGRIVIEASRRRRTLHLQTLAELPSPVRLTAAQADELKDELGRAAGALAVARRLADQPRGRPPFTWSEDGLSTLRQQSDLFRVPYLLCYDAVRRAQDGDLGEALRSCRAALNAGSAVGDTPTPLAQSSRTSYRLEVVRSLQRVLAQGVPPAKALAALQQRLAAEAEVPLLLIAARGERAALDRLCRALERGDLPLTRVLGPDPGQAYDRVDLVHAHALLLKKMNRKVEVLKLPTERHDQLRELAKPAADEPLLVRRLFHVRYPDEGYGWRKSQAQLRCAAAALAAERFRQRHGRWPERLADLVPDLLAAVPADPFDGEPLRYRPQPDGRVIYSVGQDRRDDGGLLETNATFQQTHNVGFRLWDPEQRGRPQP